ncbi:MAG TPA: hypothetical protein VMW65_07145, partial [Chloroflexota bacterium]|nr:hypothetical protein [Chloroflexota bacterium]
LLETIPFVLNSEKFVFDSEVIAQTCAFGFGVAEIAVPARYFPEASSVNWKGSIVYGLSTLGVVGKYLLDRSGVSPSRQFRAPLSDVIPAALADTIFRFAPNAPIQLPAE